MMTDAHANSHMPLREYPHGNADAGSQLAADGSPAARLGATADTAAQAALHPEGRLVYLMGASGSGKDTLLRLLQGMLQLGDRVLVAHRYITRSAGADEASIALQADEFERRARMGCFALQWDSHGLRYGIGVEIDAWLKAGNTVLVNGSRAYLPLACARYPGLQAVQVSVDPQVLRQRLMQRGRENADAIEARLLRAAQNFGAPEDCSLARLDNNGRPESAARALLALARGETALSVPQ